MGKIKFHGAPAGIYFDELKLMNLYDQNGLTFRKHERGDFVVNPSEKDMDVIKALNVKNIEINDSVGVVGHSLTFLGCSDFIEGVSIVTFRKVDINFIHNLANLQFLNVTTNQDQIIDFKKLSLLKFCQITWNLKIQNLQELRSLETFIVTEYKRVDLSELVGLKSLRHLSIINSPIAALNGIEHLERLSYLELTRLRKLKSLKGIEHCKKLKRLELEGVAVGDLDPLRGNETLEQLGIHDGKNIRSLSPLKNLHGLQTIYISGNTTLEDGDMTPILGRKDASIGTRKHYSHKSDEIDKINGTVRPKQSWDF